MFDEAILVMDARSGESVRSGGVQGAGWTRLYKAQDYYLDMTLLRGQSDAVLMGQLISVQPETDVLGTVGIENQGSVPLDSSGNFRMMLEPGLHDLHIYLHNSLVVVRGLEA